MAETLRGSLAPGTDPQQGAREVAGDQVCLYDLASGPLEQHNTAADQPDIRADYVGLMRAALERNKVLRVQHKQMVMSLPTRP